MTDHVRLGIAPGVHQIDTGYVREGLAACYLVQGARSAAIVETGHVHAVPRILAALAAAGIPRETVSHVVPTHVHLDHAGGVGALMAALPAATLVVHPRGARHLVDPAKLWAGTIGVYGAERTKALYGDPIPVPAARVVEAQDGYAFDLGDRALRCYDAPGHARHHLVVHDEATRGFFTGDNFGISYRESDGPQGPFFFPSTTPVQFEPAALHATIDRMLVARPERLYLTHFGMVEGDVPAYAALLHAGIDEHVRRARAAPPGPGRHAALVAALGEQLLAGLAARGSPLGGAAALAAYDGDLDLNAAGLEAWLDAGAR